MIEWMQRHKKWLVVTIWISTISFIAAGMVGWGSYNFSLGDKIVAEVGEIPISQKQLQNRYNQLYTQYNIDEKFDAQKAQELGLEKIALKTLIEQALLQNFALDLGLRATELEVANEIAKLEYFQKDGVFDPVLYKNLLQQNNLKPSEFEEDISNNLLVQKILSLIPFNSTSQLELETFSLPNFIEDEVKIKTLTQAKVNLTDEAIMNYWEAHKKIFEYPAEYKIEYILIKDEAQNPTEGELKALYESIKNRYLDENGDTQSFDAIKDQVLKEQKSIMAENKALREYVALKKTQNRYGQEKILFEEDKSMGIEILELIENGQVNETLKPIKVSDGFMVLKILEKTPRKIKTFDDAKKEVKQALQKQEMQKALQKQAQDLVKEGFSGENLGFIKWDQKVKNLTQEESKTLMTKIFTSPAKRGYAEINEKFVVFEILKQKLITPKNAQQIKENNQQVVGFFKNQIINKEFYEYLKNKYKISTFERKER